MLDSIPSIIEDIKNGKPVIVVDDENRENEGDLVIAASHATPANINFMIKECRGLVCVPMLASRLKELELRSMALGEPRGNSDPYATAWRMSVDVKKGTSTGISAFDRSKTVKALVSPKAQPEDFTRPGHLFPLEAKDGGVLVRAGHTESAVDLARMAGLYPAGVICEIVKDDGEMARLPDLLVFAKKHGLKICSIEDLIKFRRASEQLIEIVEEARMPTKHGEFMLRLYRAKTDGHLHVALWMGDLKKKDPVLARVHSECLTGDVFGSLRCDCGNQLDRAMAMVAKEGRGVVLYMRQEGRGIGLDNKIKAYKLQDKGLDTVEANEALGFAADLRDYGIGAQMLADLGVRHVKLITNNPKKIVGIQGYGIDVVKQVPLKIKPGKDNSRYLSTKKTKLGHLL
jgi:3,4-dihydroxy 2-butanone 4-phosphate synthase/GTP cyclohydrolase II